MRKYVYIIFALGILSAPCVYAEVKTGNKQIDDSINNRFKRPGWSLFD